MTDQLTIERLREVMAEETRGHHLDVTAVTAAALAPPPAASRPHRRRDRVAVAAALTGAAVAASVYAAVSARHGRPHPAASASCGPVQHGSLPAWARAGFTPPTQAVPHVVSTDATIVAVLFADLRVHQPAGTNNKILWTARDGGGTGPLVIRATLAGDGTTVTRTVAAGPGPSTVDLPAAGCWHMSLTWGSHHDTISIPYAP